MYIPVPYTPHFTLLLRWYVHTAVIISPEFKVACCAWCGMWGNKASRKLVILIPGSNWNVTEKWD